MKNTDNSVLLFDGVCNLCNNMVQFIIQRDTAAKIKFATLQSDYGQTILKKLNLPTHQFDTLVFIKGDQYFLKSSAVLQVLKETGGIWKLFYLLIYVPVPLRDFVYNFVAKTRFTLFGKRESCMLPSENTKKRFLS